MRKPLIYGALAFGIGLIAWVVSIIVNVLTLGEFRLVSNVIFALTMAVVPITIMSSILQRKK